MLDVPNFFWDSEPTLHPLYVAIREYLEIDPRIKVLNERLRVFLDLAEILCDSVADAKMSAITWIIIVLIFISILITVTEVLLRFTMLAKAAARPDAATPLSLPASSSLSSPPPVIVSSPPLANDLRRRRPSPAALDSAGKTPTLEELRAWSAALSEREKAAVCGSDYMGMTFAGV